MIPSSKMKSEWVLLLVSAICTAYLCLGVYIYSTLIKKNIPGEQDDTSRELPRTQKPFRRLIITLDHLSKRVAFSFKDYTGILKTYQHLKGTVPPANPTAQHGTYRLLCLFAPLFHQSGASRYRGWILFLPPRDCYDHMSNHHIQTLSHGRVRKQWWHSALFPPTMKPTQVGYFSTLNGQNYSIFFFTAITCPQYTGLMVLSWLIFDARST